MKKYQMILILTLTFSLCSVPSLSESVEEQVLQVRETEMLPYYTEPGIVGFRKDRWIGTDHLYNLPENLGIFVELVSPPNFKNPLDKEKIANTIESIFKKGGLSPRLLKGGSEPPFPYYHLLVLTMPMPNGCVGYVSARLFEDVNLPRAQLAEGIYWQSITWEEQTLEQASCEDYPKQVYEEVAEMSQTFVERFKHFEEVRQKIGK